MVGRIECLLFNKSNLVSKSKKFFNEGKSVISRFSTTSSAEKKACVNGDCYISARTQKKNPFKKFMPSFLWDWDKIAYSL